MIRQIYNLILMLIVIILCSCERPSFDKDGRQVYSAQKEGLGNYYKVIVIDSCEYIYARYVLTHKGNCTFCNQRHKEGN